MLGTLNGALEVRQVSLPPQAIRARVQGINEVLDRIPQLTEVHIHYELEIPAGSRDVVERALQSHQNKCPTARSLDGAVRIRWSADVREADAE